MSPGPARSKNQLKGRLYVNCKSSGDKADSHVMQLDEYVLLGMDKKAQAKAHKEAEEQHAFKEKFRAETRAVMERLSKPEANEILQQPAPACQTMDMDMQVLEQMEIKFKEKALVPESLGLAEDLNNISPVVTPEPTVSYQDACSLVRVKLTKRIEGQVPHPPDEGLVRRLVFQMGLQSTPAAASTPNSVDWICFLCIMAQHLRLRLPRQYVDIKSEELLGRQTLGQADHQDHLASPERARGALEARRGGLVQHYERAAEKFANLKKVERAMEMASIHSIAAMVCVRKEQRLQDMAKFDLEPCPCTSAPPQFDHMTPDVTKISPARLVMGFGGMMTLPSTHHKSKSFISTGFVL
jgi:hypothetical protein